MNHLQRARRAFTELAPTRRGQLAGVTLIALPTVVHPLPLTGAPAAVVRGLAVAALLSGAALVFGGLLLRHRTR